MSFLLLSVRKNTLIFLLTENDVIITGLRFLDPTVVALDGVLNSVPILEFGSVQGKMKL